MSEWHEFLDNPEVLRAIFGDVFLSGQGLVLHDLLLERAGPTVKLRFDVKEFPTNPPRKWVAAQANRVQVRLSVVSIKELSIEGLATNMTVDLTAIREGFDIRYHLLGQGISMTALAKGGHIDLISAAQVVDYS